MTKSCYLCLLICVFSLASFGQKKQKKVSTAANDAILVFSKTKGYRHASIPKGKQAIMLMGQQNGFSVDTSENADVFNLQNLKKYKAVVFLSTTGNILDETQQGAFEQYIRGGGGFVGIHAAADTEYDWPWYNQLVGAYFLSHPKQQNVDVVIHEKNHPSTSMLPDRWRRFDELYSYKKMVLGIKVIGTLDETTYQGGQNGVNHPFIWFREFDGGRSFYTGGGHTDESFVEPLFVLHLLGGIEYSMGRKSPKKPI